MAEYILYGAGEHGKVVADALLSAGEKIIGFVDDREPQTDLLGIDYLGKWDGCAKKYPDSAWHVSIGNNFVRSRITNRIEEELGKEAATIIHPAAIISRFTKYDAGCFFAAGCVVGPSTTFERSVIVNHGATVDHDNIIGSFVHICPGVHLAGSVIICDNTFVGVGASVMPGISIGEDVTVGAGAVVIGNIDPEQTVFGNPAVGRRLKGGSV
jgi:sugar O-acyltransferase (sialic acid O-acetyltransferase NeuD family)